MERYVHWYTDTLKKYAVFEGRATRQEYWMFFLLNFIVSILVSVVAEILHSRGLSTLYSLAVLIPSIAILVRRLHDTNRSGWWTLLIFVPIIGWIALFIFSVQKSRPNSMTDSMVPKKSDTQTMETPTASTEEKTEAPIEEVAENKTSVQ